MKVLCVILTALCFAGAASAADMPLKAPPAPVAGPGWTGFYVGGEAGWAWSNAGDNWVPNDIISSFWSAGSTPLFSPFPGQQPLASPYNVRRSGGVGGLEAGYNWQFDPRWVAGIEADINGADFRGTGTSVSTFTTSPPGINNNLATSQNMGWYGTLRGRLGWLAAPNVLIFGTAGLAYGRTSESASFTFTAPATGFISAGAPGATLFCVVNSPCYQGSTSSTNVGWVAGGGVEWMFARHWSAKLEYQFVSLGSTTVLAVAPPAGPGLPGSSFNVMFKDQMNIVRAGVNYRF